MKQYYIYLLTNKYNTVFYTGVTNNLVRKIYEHKNKLSDGFTKKYNVEKLVYYEIYSDPENAITREKTIKNLLRNKKIALIQNKNPEYKDLYEEII
jgi:putative endonuclease